MPISNLNELLKSIQPVIYPEKYFFASIEEKNFSKIAPLTGIVCFYREKEGITIVFPEPLLSVVENLSIASVNGPFALITLNVYSDLLAIGFLAKITEVLAKKEISVNAFSAYHHDHLLIPFDKSAIAVNVLQDLAKRFTYK